MENKNPLPGDELNRELPNFMNGISDLKKDLSGLPDMLKKFQTQLGERMKVMHQKEGLLKGKKVAIKILAGGEVLIKWQDKGEEMNFYNSVK